MNLVPTGGRRTGRLALTAAAVTALTLGLGGPAQADPEEPAPDPVARVWAFVSDMTIAPAGAPGKNFDMEVLTSQAVNPRVVIDVTELAGLATFDFPANCTVQGTTAACPAPPGSVDNNATLSVPVRAVAGAPAGAHGTVRVRGDADNPGDGQDLMQQEAVITVSGDGPDLALINPVGIPDAQVGDRVNARMTVTNLGNRAVKGLRVIVDYSFPLDPTPYANCRYGHRTTFPERGTVAVCDFTRRIDPGGVYGLKTGFGAVVTDAAVDDEVMELSVVPLAGAGLPDGIDFAGRGGKALSLNEITAAPAKAKISSADDIDTLNDERYLGFTVENLLDTAAVGATVEGAVGDTVRVEVGARNMGGAIDYTRYGSSAARFTFKLPYGTVVQAPPANCELGEVDPQELFESATYVCQLPSLYFAPDATFLRTFDLTITGPSYYPGTVKAPADGPVIDEDYTNDHADVTLTVTP